MLESNTKLKGNDTCVRGRGEHIMFFLLELVSDMFIVLGIRAYVFGQSSPEGLLSLIFVSLDISGMASREQ